jgi:diaminohydroxyphosphoribosylaminopyrimidine deaminase/5-amino-6-(5-phosphoribosylamino)uracil reductase
MMNEDDFVYMARALRLAERGVYATPPNPTVGCVLVRDGSVVAEGWTAPTGGPHAERVALASAGERARGATAYVTLEPCSHTGRTGPCTDALIAAGVARVVYAIDDPNPRVAGGGSAALRAAGVVVESGPLAAEAHALNRGFFARMTRGRPWVRCKIAASLDGRTALANGTSKWITSDAARHDVHRWRARAGAVLTGVGTVIADDPALDARPEPDSRAGEAPVRQPLRVVLDSRLRVPASARTFTRPGRSVIFTCRDAAHTLAAGYGPATQIEIVPADPAGGCELHAVMRRLAELEVNDVWVEAGARLNGALLSAGLIDELVVYSAPIVLGDRARAMFALPELERMEDRRAFEIVDVARIGPDLRITAHPITVPQH